MMTKYEFNEALAEMIGPAGYENSRYCQQGHRTENNILMHNGEPSDVCARCLPAEYIYEALTAIEDPAWHPEWRIPQQPKDFSRPGVLEPLAVDIIKRWVDRWGLNKDKVGYSIEQRSLAPYKEIAVCMAAMSPMGDYIIGFGRGASYEEALGEAMLSDHRTLNDPHR